jgi:hypothetical protein
MTQIPVADGSIQAAFIKVSAAHSVAIFDSNETNLGLIYDDIWDETALVALPASIISSDAIYTIMGTQEGFSRASTLTTSVVLSAFFRTLSPFSLAYGTTIGTIC